jgi:hypothetical protein
VFNPITIPTLAPIAAPAATQDELPPAPPMMLIQPPKPDKNKWDVGIVQRAQGIYPSEANAKASQIQQAKQPTPTGAWGKPR